MKLKQILGGIIFERRKMDNTNDVFYGKVGKSRCSKHYEQSGKCLQEEY